MEFKPHSAVLVPLETWAYHSPQLRRKGQRVDIGGLIEALVYYDSVYANVQRASDLEAIIERFARDGSVDLLRSLITSGALRLFNFAFDSMPIEKDGRFGLLNVQGEDQKDPGWIDRGVLNRVPLERWFSKGRHRRSLLEAIRANGIEVKALEFAGVIANAEADILDSDRAALLLQTLLDQNADTLGGSVPEATANVVTIAGGHRQIRWNVDWTELGKRIGDASMGPHTPISAAIITNRLIWAAARTNLDLFVGSPLDHLVGDKLYEISSRRAFPQAIVQQLQEEVDFPDVRALVNGGVLPVSEALRLREKGDRFRRWLQGQADQDGKAIHAYHHEVAKEAGFTRGSRKVLRMLSTPGASAVGAVTLPLSLAATGSVEIAGAATAVAGAGAKFLLDALSKMDEGWKPVMFGGWAKKRIEKYLRKAEPKG